LGNLGRKMDLIRGQVHFQIFSRYTWTDLRGAGHPTGESLDGIFCADKLNQPFRLQAWKKGWQLAENAAIFVHASAPTSKGKVLR